MITMPDSVFHELEEWAEWLRARKGPPVYVAFADLLDLVALALDGFANEEDDVAVTQAMLGALGPEHNLEVLRAAIHEANEARAMLDKAIKDAEAHT